MDQKPKNKNIFYTKQEIFCFLALPLAIIIYTLIIATIMHWPFVFAKYAFPLNKLTNLNLIVPSIITIYCIIICCSVIRINKPFVEYFALNTFNIKTILKWVFYFILISLFTGYIKHEHIIPISPNWELVLYNKHLAIIIFFIITVLIIPILEEILFRGIIFSGIEESFLGKGGAVVISAYLWSIPSSSYNPYVLLSNMLLGILLGMSRYKTNSIYVPIILHLINSMIEFITIVMLQH